MMKGADKLANKQIVVVPDIGTDANVDVIEILVKKGDKVTQDAPLLTLESEKASMDVPSPYAGEVLSMTVKVGDKVKQGDALLELSLSEAVDNAVESEKASSTSAVLEQQNSMPTVKETPAATTSSSSSSTTAETSIKNVAQQCYASPAVRRLANALNIDLLTIQGSGKKGRIQLADLAASMTNNTGTGTAAANFSLPVIDHAKFGPIEMKPLSKIQKISGANLQRNWNLIPHVTQFDEADITELESFRKAQQMRYKAEGIRVTLLPFLMKAVVAALQNFPKFNTSLQGDTLVYKQYFHIGVAVDTPNGLVVPVIRDVDKKGILALSQELAVISEKARTKGLSLPEMQGSSFTISSLGGIGGTAFTPIVNWPDVAILGVSRSQMKPQYQDGNFSPRLMLPLSLSYDHRVIDGADGARFTRYLANLLTDIRQLVL